MTHLRVRAGGAGAGAPLSGDGSPDSYHCSSVKLSFHPTGLSQEEGVLLCSPSTWLTMFTLPWRYPETPRHSCKGGSTQAANLSCRCIFSQRTANPTKAAASLATHCSSCQEVPNPTQMATGLNSHRYSNQVAPNLV